MRLKYFSAFPEKTVIKEETEVTKFTKRILLIAAALLLVLSLSIFGSADGAGEAQGPVCYEDGDINGDGILNNKDAIYTLYNYMFGDERFPVNQSPDFNDDGVLNNKDALYIMYAYMDTPSYELDGIVHNYYDPVWSWSDSSNTVTASVSFKCGCGETKSFTVSNGVTVSISEEQEATCVTAGFVKYVASVVLNDQTYTAEKTVTVPAGDGHNMVGTTNCENGSYCSLCDYKELPLGHTWVKGAYTPATCTSNAVQAYSCACGESKTVEEEGTAGHVLSYKGDAQVSGCKYVKQYTCSGCSGTFNGTAEEDTFYIHSYTATLEEATCVKEGKKTYSCSACGAASDKVEVVPVNNAHDWEECGTENGVTSYSCKRTGCTATKTTVSVDNNSTTDKAALQSAQELQLAENTAIALDEEAQKALDDDRDIKITVDKVPVNNLTLTQEQKAQIGDNPVFDFNMIYTDTQEKVSNFGENAVVTVSLPYELQDGDDIDSIDVWFIADNGTPTEVKGTYANGFVTFTTNHFSYYTVIRLTPAQRCKRYGHIEVTATKAVSCTEDGYEVTTCQRCGAETAKEVTPKLGHNFTTTATTPATCTAAGSTTSTCSNCKHTVTTQIPALGHNLELDTAQTVIASCTQAGQSVQVCTADNCSYHQILATPQLAHDYQDHEQKNATCTEKGYTTRKCTGCQDVITTNETAPLGHEFLAQNAVWTWTEDYTATLNLTCTHDEAHTVRLNAVISSQTTDGGCSGTGNVTYTATASYNNVAYTDTRTQTTPPVGHKPEGQWTTTTDYHFHLCSKCKEPVDAAEHSWDAGTVIKEATCGESGTMKYTCTVCQYEKTPAIPATGKHVYENGVCTGCGRSENECRHTTTIRTLVDLSGSGLCEGAEVYFFSCSCGKEQYYTIYSLSCQFGESEEVTVNDSNGSYSAERSSCTVCGLTCTSYEYMKISTDPCYIGMHRIAIYTMGDTVLFKNDYSKQGTEHGTDVFYDTIDLSEYGLCGEVLELYTCPCEQYSHTSVLSYERKCNWQFDPEISSKFIEGYTCTVCGAQRTEEYLRLESDFQCQYLYGYRYTYYMNGQVIYTYDNIRTEYDHSYLPTKSQLLGDDCEDGVLVEFTCQHCGNSQEVCMFYHANLPLSRIDTTDSDICCDAIVQYGCPCGETLSRWRYEGDNQCQWEFLSQEGDLITYRCSVCNATQEDTCILTKVPNCLVEESTTAVFKDRNGTQLATVYIKDSYQSHNITSTTTFLGNTCEDGVKIAYACTNCDYTYNSTWYDHSMNEIAHYDLSAYNSCYTDIYIYSCPCSMECWVYWEGDSSCNWQFVGGSEFGSVYRCTTCGLERASSSVYTPGFDACHRNVVTTITLSRNDTQLLSFQYKTISTNHSSIYSFQLNPGAVDCEGGYSITESCTKCNYSSSGTGWGHQTYVVARQEFPQGTLCGKLSLNTYACACNDTRYTNTYWEDGHCQFNNYIPDDTYGMLAVCSTCGSKRADTGYSEPAPDRPCGMDHVNISIIMDPNGNELFRYEQRSQGTNHNYAYTFQPLNGSTSCDEGYILIGTCTVCGDVTRSEEYGCNTYPVESVILAQLEGMCGTVKLQHDRCFCGANDSWNRYDPCNWAYQDDGNKLCTSCGAVQNATSTEIRTPGSCQVTTSLDYTTTLNGESYHKQYSFATNSHVEVYSFRMEENASCEDGFYVDSHCIYCNHSNVGTELVASGIHQTYIVERIDLDVYGGCSNGAHIDVEQCACGANAGVELFTGNCNMQSTGNTDAATQAQEYYCETCQCYLYFNKDEQVDRNNCARTITAYFKVVKDGEVKKEVSRTFNLTAHDYTIVSSNFAPYGPGSDCQNGVDLSLRCLVCNATATKHVRYHEAHTAEYVDLAQMGACGGNIVHLRCACGTTDYINKDFACQNFSTNMEKTEMGSDGYEHSIWSVTCKDCGLTRTEDSYDVKIEGVCRAKRFRTITVTLDSTTKSFSEKTEIEYHGKRIPLYSEPITEELCGNGFSYDTICNDCHQRVGAVSLGSHSTISVKDNIQLASYGSTCGGWIELTTCTCGKVNSWRFSDDTACDFTGQSTDFFMENALTDSFQQSVMGSQTYYHEAYQYYCAVTDPLCNMKIRTARYWVAGENCTAKEMITLQLGYDPATDTFIREFTFETGETGFYHTYESESFDGKQDDGVTYSGDTYTCTTCGSTHTHTVYHKPTSDYWWKCEDIFVNALNDGNYKTLTITEYQTVDGNCCYISQTDKVYTTATGEEVQEWYTYSFDFENNCTRTETFRDSLGNSYTSAIPDYHQYNWHHTTVKAPTCSQIGIRNDKQLCDGCGLVVQDQNFTTSPNGHDLCYNEEIGLYVCSVCGLESISGGNGAVILEDMTATHGAGTQAVIGYYNGTESNFTVYLSVILENTENTDNQIDLNFADFTYLDDEITAVCFDMAAAQAVAAEAIGDYTGAYALRLSFVPADDSQLEYAITFDSLMAE